MIRKVAGWVILAPIFGLLAAAVASEHGWATVIAGLVIAGLIMLGLWLVAG